MAGRITYTDKEQGQVSTQPVNRRWQYLDANEVKAIVNAHADDIEAEQAKGLQDVTDNSGNTTNDINLREQAVLALYDALDDPTGFVGADGFYGVVIGGTSDGITFDTPISMKGSSSVMLSDTLGIAFNGAEAGNFLRILNPVTLPNGDTVFPVASVALDVTEYSETFSDANDYTLNNATYTTVVQGTTTNQYRLNTSQANYSFLVENNANQTRTITYSLTVNDAAPTDLFTVEVPRNTTIPVNGADTVSDSQIEIGDTVELKVLSSGGSTTVKGTSTPSEIIMEQSAALVSSGALNQSFVNGGNVHYVRSLSEFPAPSSGVITITEDSSVWQIIGPVNLGVNKLEIDADNVKIQGNYAAGDQLISTVSGDSMISTTNHSIDLEKLTLVAPLSTYVIESDGSGLEVLTLQNVTIAQCNDCIRANNLLAISINGPSLWTDFTNGLLCQGYIDNGIVKSTLMKNVSGVAIDLNGMTTRAIDISENSVTVNTGATFLSIASNGGNIVSNGEGSIRANKIDNSGGGTAITGYSSLEPEWAVILNTTNIIPSDRIEPNGWGFYVDDATVTQNFDDTPTQLTINGLGSSTNETKLPLSIRGIDNLWNTTDDCIKPITEGDSYDLRVILQVTGSNGNPTRFRVALDIGATPDGTGTGGSIVIAEDNLTLRSGQFPQSYTITFPIFTLGTFIANGGTLWVSADSGDIDVEERQILIVRTSSGAN